MNPIEDIKRIHRELAEFSSYVLHVGVLGESDSDFLKIAGAHEYGCEIKVTPEMRAFLHAAKGVHLKASTTHIHIPERSYIRKSFDEGLEDIQGYVKRAVDKIIKGEYTAEEAANAVGAQATMLTQNFINENKVTPKSEGYFGSDKNGKIKYKTQNTTLFDSGRLVGSITYRIEKR